MVVSAAQTSSLVSPGPDLGTLGLGVLFGAGIAAAAVLGLLRFRKKPQAAPPDPAKPGSPETSPKQEEWEL